MESLSTNLFQYLHAIWRRKWLTALAAWAICAVGWSVVAMLPSKYESTARVYVDGEGLLAPLLRGITVDVDPAQQLDMLQRTLLSRANLEQLIHMAGLDNRIRTPADKDQMIQSLLASIVIQPQTRNLFTLSYQDRNPTVARDVVQSLLTIFAESTTGTAREQMDNAQRFLSDQIALYEKQLRAAEQRQAAFREQHLDVLGGGGANANLDQMRNRVQQAQSDLQDAIARRDSLQKELTQLPAEVAVDSADPDQGSVQQRLIAAQRQLADLRTRFTDQHPDVIALKAKIDALSKQADAKGGSGTRRGQASNSVYQQVKVRLVEAQSTVAAAQRRLQDTQADQTRLKSVAQTAPSIEAQAQDLDRDYSVLKHNYDELLSRREAANLAQAADSKGDKIQFRVVDAPQVALNPVAPNRPVLFTAVLLAGVLGGIFIPIMLMQIDSSFASLQRLRMLGHPVIGGISYVAMLKTRGQAMFETAGFGATAVALLLLYGVLIAMTLNIHRVLSGSIV